MIRKPNNWNEVKEFSDRPKLPLGAYVCKVKKAVVQSTDYGDSLCVLFDIVDGEYKGFFQKDFDSSTVDNKKWRGVLRQFLPRDDGSEKDEWTKSSFKGLTASFEKSNPGYQWNWDEASLVGKMVGILFRNEEWEYDGKTGWAVRPFRAISVDSARSGEFTLPKDKPLKNKTVVSSYQENNFNTLVGFVDQNFADLPDDDNELPF